MVPTNQTERNEERVADDNSDTFQASTRHAHGSVTGSMQ